MFIAKFELSRWFLNFPDHMKMKHTLMMHPQIVGFLISKVVQIVLTLYDRQICFRLLIWFFPICFKAAFQRIAHEVTSD